MRSLFVADMQEAIEKIGLYVQGMTIADFQANSRMVDAVVYELFGDRRSGPMPAFCDHGATFRD